MFNKMINILTFGLYNRLVEAERQAQSYYSELKRMIENLDIDGAVEEEINKRDILTQDNFSPSDFDIVTSDDYDFDSFLSTDDYNLDDFMDYDDVQKELTGLVHETEIEEVIEKKNRNEIDKSVQRALDDTIVDLAHKSLERRKKEK
jgi:hypothetical protein